MREKEQMLSRRGVLSLFFCPALRVDEYEGEIKGTDKKACCRKQHTTVDKILDLRF